MSVLVVLLLVVVPVLDALEAAIVNVQDLVHHHVVLIVLHRVLVIV